MKKTIITKTIDSIEIVVGMDVAVQDPIATRENAEAILNEKPIVKEYSDQQGIVSVKMKSRLLLFRKKNSTDAEIQLATNEVNRENDKLIEIASRMNSEFHQIQTENRIYFEPKPGEEIISEEQEVILKESFRNKSFGQLVKKDGLIIDDNRGKVRYKKINGKWTEKPIEKLNEKIEAGGKWEDELTDLERIEVLAHRELARVKALSKEEKIDEKEKALSGALNQSVYLRSSLEIQKDDQALEKSQADYEAKKAALEAKYK